MSMGSRLNSEILTVLNSMTVGKVQQRTNSAQITASSPASGLPVENERGLEKVGGDTDAYHSPGRAYPPIT